MTNDLSEGDLRLLYLEWCSTQVARRFLELSHDEVWLRSHLASSPPAISESSPVSGPSSDVSPDTVARIPGYLELVRKTALLLAKELDLPSFPDWKKSYIAAPEAFSADLLRSS